MTSSHALPQIGSREATGRTRSNAVVTHSVDLLAGACMMRYLFVGMFGMMDLTALFLAQVPSTLPWERHILYSMIGGTLGFGVYGMLYGLDLHVGDKPFISAYVREVCRRSLAAIFIAVLFGPATAAIVAGWLGTDMQILLVPSCALASMAGPYAVEQYGKRALDASIRQGLKILGDDQADR